MAEITLQRPELLVLLDALEVASVVGIDREDLIPDDLAAHRALVQQGHALLEKRGGLRVEPDGVIALTRDLADLARVVAFPDVASIIVRDMPGVGRQLFIHCQKGGLIIEHTLPQPELHRFETLPDRAALVDRITALLPVAESATSGSFDMTVDGFMTMKGAAESGDLEQAGGLLRAAGASQADADGLIDAIRQPDFSASLALLKCEGQTIVDGRNPLVVTSVRSSWLISPKNDDPNSVTLRAINRAILGATFGTLWSELSEGK